VYPKETVAKLQESDVTTKLMSFVRVLNSAMLGEDAPVAGTNDRTVVLLRGNMQSR